jgi:hypothetical protein
MYTGCVFRLSLQLYKLLQPLTQRQQVALILILHRLDRRRIRHHPCFVRAFTHAFLPARLSLRLLPYPLVFQLACNLLNALSPLLRHSITTRGTTVKTRRYVNSATTVALHFPYPSLNTRNTHRA